MSELGLNSYEQIDETSFIGLFGVKNSLPDKKRDWPDKNRRNIYDKHLLLAQKYVNDGPSNIAILFCAI